MAIIPARGGSRGLPGKNIRPLLGRPLIEYSIEFSKQLPGNVDCIVSTDDDDIADIARNAGASVPFIRPKSLATDESPMSDVISHAVKFMENQKNIRYEWVLLLEPTCPTRSFDSIESAASTLMRAPSLDGVIAVSEPSFHPEWVGVSKSNEEFNTLVRYSNKGNGVTRRQSMGRFLRINGNFYLWRADFARNISGSWFDSGNFSGEEIPESHAFDIDTIADFEILEAVVRAGLAPLPGYEKGK